MSLLPYEILLRYKDDGTFSGGHTIRRDSVTGQLSAALPIGADKSFPWPTILGEVNTGLAAKAGEVDDVKVQLAAAEMEKAKQADILSTIKAAVTDPETDTDTAVLAIVTEATKDERQKIIDAATAEIEKQQAIIASA